VSHNCSLRTVRIFWFVAASLAFIGAGTGAGHAAEDRPAPGNAPGILIEPPTRNNEDADRRDSAPSNEGQRREGERPGCPVNNRPLELLV
jgi:hypothetical protein